MADPVFFDCEGPFSLKDIASLIGAEVKGDGETHIHDVAPLSTAKQGQISFLDNAKYKDQLKESQASACLIHPDMVDQAPSGMALLLSDAPYLAYARIAAHFYPDTPSGDIHPTALVDPTAVIEEGVTIGPYCVVGRGVHIGAGCVLESHIHLSHTLMGKHCTIYRGAQIGQNGFGFAPSPTGMVPIPQLGRVLIGDHVSIGANSCVDRGAGPDTCIGDGTIIDNLVQVAHNVEIGKGCIITSQVGISGSTRIGDYCVIGGQTGFAGHLTIGKGVRIAGQSGVTNDIPDGAEVAGFPAQDKRSFWKEKAFLRRLMKRDT